MKAHQKLSQMYHDYDHTLVKMIMSINLLIHFLQQNLLKLEK